MERPSRNPPPVPLGLPPRAIPAAPPEARKGRGAVTKTGANLKSVVTFSAQVPTTFLKIAGFTNITVNGTSSAGGSHHL